MKNLNKALLLHRYMLHLFGVSSLEVLSEHLSDTRHEGYDENNISHFHHILLQRLFSNELLNADMLLEYDQNIYRHTGHINEEREEKITWKYFQYLSMLFMEIYLDKYFNNKYQLCSEINDFVDRFNDPFDKDVQNELDEDFPHFTMDDLNKLAFWNATGSGKTLIMHVNILQILHHAEKYKRGRYDNILLITPNKGLSHQHLTELKASNISVEGFSKSGGGLFSAQTVKVIEITKMAEDHGDTTVAYESFEQNNIVLIDEGHRGINGKQWKRRRDWLSERGFAIEYSATFGQAVSTASSRERKSLITEYGKAILFDYSYKYFYHDGYGKDYRILNLPSDEDAVALHKYLVGSLLSFYQQKLIWQVNQKIALEVFLIDNPLWVFVGGRVYVGYSKSEATDIWRIIYFYQEFVENASRSVDIIGQILSAADGLVDKGNRSIFRNSFEYLQSTNLSAEQIYQDILLKIFNTSLSGANLYVDNLQGQDGELGIRIGNAEYFGLINVGDSAKLFKQTQKKGILGVEIDFNTSLFHAINESGSRVNVLIGAKKFTEGWSSWRVSTMGLMNVGRGQGSQIIQLFGRGVRLKGYNFNLKRSATLEPHERPGIEIPDYISKLETLNVFGIRADYMDQFKEILEEEGLPVNDKAYITVNIPVLPSIALDKAKLKIFRVRENVDFKKKKVISLEADALKKGILVKLDWYPKVMTYHSANQSAADIEMDYRHQLSNEHLSYLNWYEIYEEIIRFKNDRSWYNLSIDSEVLPEILKTKEWYDLALPEDELQFDSYEKVARWEEIATALLKKYIDKYYNFKKQEFLQDYIEVLEVTPGDPSMIPEYKMEIEQSMESIIRQIKGVKSIIEKAELQGEATDLPQGISIFEFANHLYMPLISINESKYRDLIKISPVSLNSGEKQFVMDLKDFYLDNPEYFAERSLYLLRNTSRKGIGFFEANGFYPDFILWQVEGDVQYIAFIDPKGLTRVTGMDHAKIRFYKEIKETIEPRVHEQDAAIYLSSFIVSVTPYEKLNYWKGQDSLKGFNDHNVYFQKGQKEVYIKDILEKARVKSLANM